jgi:sugar phosphate permease
VTLFYLTDRPQQAQWLSAEQREWLTAELAREKRVKQGIHSISIFRALVHREVLLLTSGYFFMVTAVYGFNFWLPTILKRISGSSNLVVTLISALPYCAALLAMLVVGWSSDRTGERRWHTALSMITAGIGLLLSMYGRDNTGVAVAMFCIAAAGMYSYLPGFWALPSSFLVGTTAAAASIGMINSIGNLGGFAGPFVIGYLSERTGSFVPGVLYLAVSAVLAACLILLLRATKRERSASEIVSSVGAGEPEGV